MAIVNYATSDDDAKDRAQKWRHVDPFPAILPALLNAADIRDYVAATGMLYPFKDDQTAKTEKLKPASYEVDLLGDYVLFDEEGQRRTGHIAEGDEFRLPSNSIAFVTLEPEFRLPQYIALRFNLRITHVYRGLLLGTGPLIDPGFTGRLSIPLHNLTTNDYALHGGEGLIWVEFTKLSPEENAPKHPPEDYPSRAAAAIPVPELPAEKKNKNVAYYLRRAEPHRPVRSGIPAATAAAEEAAREAQDETRRFRRRLDVSGLVGLAGVVALLISFWTLISDTNERLNSVPPGTTDQVRELEQEVQDLERQIDDLRDSIPQPGVTVTPSP